MNNPKAHKSDAEATHPNSPLISIALATYNGAVFLEEQLTSLYAQDYPNLQIVACDDASTDATAAILQRWQTSHGLQVHINPKNLGFVRNFEQCLQRCAGEYILLCDQDDLWEPEKVSRLYQAISSTESLLVYSDATLIDESGKTLPQGLWEALNRHPIGVNSRHSFYLNTIVTGCTVILDRKLLSLALPIPEGFTFHDWWLGYVAAQHDGLGFLAQRLTRYRQHAANIAGAGIADKKNNPGKRFARLKPWIKWHRKLAAQDKQVADLLLHLQIFHRYEIAQGLDSQTSAKLLQWAHDFNNKYSLNAYRTFFSQNPQLFALSSHPAKVMRRNLKSRRQRQLKILRGPISTAAIACALAIIWLA